MTRRYLIDTNIFIELKNSYYDFAVCPGFWDWVKWAHAKGKAYSTRGVMGELVAQGDELSDWVHDMPKSFFLGLPQDFNVCKNQLLAWAKRGPYRNDVVADYISGVDAGLVIMGISTGYTVVTHEKSSPFSKTNIKMPDACRGTHVDVMMGMEMLRKEKASFHHRG